MPIYEYFCPECREVFELLRPVRVATAPQSCPSCDAEATRRVPTDVNPFTQRDGIARALPDRGKYWHLDQEVEAPISSAARPGDHPELMAEKYGPPDLPTTEEFEEFQHKVERRLEVETNAIASGHPPIRDAYQEQQVGEFVKRVRSTASRARQAKKRAPNSKITARMRPGRQRDRPPIDTDGPSRP